MYYQSTYIYKIKIFSKSCFYWTFSLYFTLYIR